MAAALALMATGAHASEASAVADRGGFLLGHAYRCGVAAERLDPSARLVHDLIDALSDDATEKPAAEQVFTNRFLASLLATALRDPKPSCASVLGELTRLERHEPTASAEGEARMSNENRSENAPPQHRPTLQTARSKKPASTRREDLTPDRRADLALKLVAKPQRNRPPSI
jgi:hypothetical protein